MSQKESLGFSLSLRSQEILGNPCCQLLKGTIAFETKEPMGMERVIAKGGLGDHAGGCNQLVLED